MALDPSIGCEFKKILGKAVQYAVRGSKVRLVPAESYMIGPFFILSKHHESVTIQGGDYSIGKEKERGGGLFRATRV